MIVPDASALLDLLLRRPAADRVEEAVGRAQYLHAPHLLDTEILQCLRRWVRRGDLELDRAETARQRFADLPIVRHPHDSLSDAVWALRNRLSAYDATYAALAISLDATLLTSDSRFAHGAQGLVAVTDVS